MDAIVSYVKMRLRCAWPKSWQFEENMPGMLTFLKKCEMRFCAGVYSCVDVNSSLSSAVRLGFDDFMTVMCHSVCTRQQQTSAERLIRQRTVTFLYPDDLLFLHLCSTVRFNTPEKMKTVDSLQKSHPLYSRS